MLPLRKLAPKELMRSVRYALFDMRFGGYSGGHRQNPDPDGYTTNPTEYALMPQIFNGRIRPFDVLVDVGCGAGRVINYWLSLGIKNRIIGLELFEEVAESTRRRLGKYGNVTIVPGDAVANLPADGTLFYMFNPFVEAQVVRFEERLAQLSPLQPQMQLIYYAPVSLSVFRAAGRWNIEEFELAMPQTGKFKERHRHLAVMTAKSG